MRKSADEFLKKYALLPERFFFRTLEVIMLDYFYYSLISLQKRFQWSHNLRGLDMIFTFLLLKEWLSK